MRSALAGLGICALMACSSSPSKSQRSGPKQVSPATRQDDASPPGPSTGASLDGYRISGPFTHRNLAVFLLHVEQAPRGDVDYLTLDEALKAGVVRMSEFRKLWPRLLRSCAVEAMTGKKEKKVLIQLGESDVRRVFQEAAGTEGKVEKRPEGTTVRVYENKSGVLFDTEKDGRLLHR